MVLLRERRKPGAVLLLNHTSFAIEGLYVIKPCDAAGDPRVGGFEAILPPKMSAKHVRAVNSRGRTVPLVRYRTSKVLLPQPFSQFTTQWYQFTYLGPELLEQSCEIETGDKANKTMELRGKES